MKSFKEFLKEDTFATDETWIREWLDTYNYAPILWGPKEDTTYNIQPDGTVDVVINPSSRWAGRWGYGFSLHGSFTGNTLPIKFGHINSGFIIESDHINSFKGFPNTCEGIIDIKLCTHINSFIGIADNIKSAKTYNICWQ